MLRDYIPIIRRDETSKIFVDDVLCIEQELRKAVIYTMGDTYWCYGKISDLSKHLDNRFFQCHQSYIINMDRVVKMREQTIYFENGFKITIGRDKFSIAKQSFSAYLIQGAYSDNKNNACI
jgi:DNA-binding LytR/AlgR family response regulator